MSYQVKNRQRITSRQSLIRRLHDKGFKIIYLKRENVIHQAVSSVRARKFGFRRRSRSEKATREKITIDVNWLLRRLGRSMLLDRYEESLLRDVPHLSLSYEEHLLRAEDHQPTLDRVCDYLGIERGTVETSLQKVSPHELQDSVANYAELVSAVKDTPFAKHLD